jgi:hypothetical protein
MGYMEERYAVCSVQLSLPQVECKNTWRLPHSRLMQIAFSIELIAVCTATHWVRLHVSFLGLSIRAKNMGRYLSLNIGVQGAWSTDLESSDSIWAVRAYGNSYTEFRPSAWAVQNAPRL